MPRSLILIVVVSLLVAGEPPVYPGPPAPAGPPAGPPAGAPAPLPAATLSQPIAPDGWESVGTVAREDIQVTLWRARGHAGLAANRVYAVLYNRNPYEVVFDWTVATSLTELRVQSTVLGPLQKVGELGEFPIDTAQPRPQVQVRNVARVAISEINGYVRMDEHLIGGVSGFLFRSQASGERVYVVLVNGNAGAVEVAYSVRGILASGGEIQARVRVPGAGTIGAYAELAYRAEIAFGSKVVLRPTIRINEVRRVP